MDIWLFGIGYGAEYGTRPGNVDAEVPDPDSGRTGRRAEPMEVLMSLPVRGRSLPSRLRSGAILATAAFLLIKGSAGATARTATPSGVTPTGVTSSTWGWVVARHPATHHYTPSLKDRGNSSGGINTVSRTGVGRYNVTMPGIGAGGGIVHVTPLGAAPHVCIIVEWGGSPDQDVSLRCFTRSGSPADSKFVANYLVVTSGSGGSSGRLGYLWANDETATDYTPDPNYSYNSSGGTNTIHRDGTGRYEVNMPGLTNANHGDVQVTAYGATVACRVVEWAPAAGALNAIVLCRDIAGARVDGRFTVTYMKDLALKGFNGTRSYYLWANQKSTTNYHPDPNFTFSTVGAAPPSIHRAGTGTYVATLPGMKAGGGVQITSYGTGRGRCILTSISTSGPTQHVGVRCFTVAGHLQDARFTLAYAR